MAKPILDNTKRYICTEPIFEIFQLKDLENCIIDGSYSPQDEDYPEWLDYIEFYVHNDTCITITIKGSPVELTEGSIIVYNTQAEVVQAVYNSEDEFFDSYWTKGA